MGGSDYKSDRLDYLVIYQLLVITRSKLRKESQKAISTTTSISYKLSEFVWLILTWFVCFCFNFYNVCWSIYFCVVHLFVCLVGPPTYTQATQRSPYRTIESMYCIIVSNQCWTTNWRLVTTWSIACLCVCVHRFVYVFGCTRLCVCEFVRAHVCECVSEWACWHRNNSHSIRRNWTPQACKSSCLEDVLVLPP